MSERNIFVTGSSRGIGKAVAMRLAEQGYGLVIHGRTQSDNLNEVEAQLKSMGVAVRVLHFDISDRQRCSEIITQDIEQHGCYYGTVLNAGLTRDSAFPFMQDHEWDDVLSVNLDSFYNVLKPIIEPLILARKGGRIIAMSSVAGIMGNRGQVNYSASKAGIIGAVKALGFELAKRRITVNCVAPGLIETDMSEEVTDEHIIPLIPMRRAGKTEEVAAVVSFLLSDDAAYITRQVISVDGGLS
ncbi:MAG: 3-oxoacyl-ACP reductase FabG [Gammaproteobacteria bacterium]|nr:3-oxoacyl-ACP reductase FabG [Gammaproteobacteria bacterium]